MEGENREIVTENANRLAFCPSTAMYKVRTRYYGREIAWLAAGLGVCAAAYYFSAPEHTVPVTGRKYRRLVPPELSNLVESSIAYYQVVESYKSVLPANHPYVREITSIGNVLTDANGMQRHEYIVIESEDANAFVVGGNVVFVYTGIASMLANASGTAMVLGHEMGHVLAGHSTEGLLQGITLIAIAIGVELFGMGAGSSSVTQLWQVLFQLPRKRQAELEADEIGYHLMSTAGFDRREAIGVYERMMGDQVQVEGDFSDFLSTHPVWPLRVALLQNLIATDLRPTQWIRLPNVMPINFKSGALMRKVRLEANDEPEEVIAPVPTIIETTPTAQALADSDSSSFDLWSILDHYRPYAILGRLAGARAESVRQQMRAHLASKQAM